MKTRFNRFLTISGTGNTGFTIPVRCRLVDLAVQAGSVSAGATAAGACTVQVVRTSSSAFFSSGDERVYAQLDLPIGGIAAENSNSIRVCPYLICEAKQIFTLIVLSAANTTVFASAHFFFEEM